MSVARSALLFASPRHRLFPYLHQQAVHGFGRLRHGVVELQRRIILIAEQFRLLRPQSERFGDDAAIVGLTAIFAARRPGPESLFAQFPSFGEGQERLDDRARQRDRVFIFLAALARGRRHRISQEIRNPRQVLFARQDQRPVLLVRENVLPEPSAETGELLVDRREALLLGLVKLGACLHEALPVALQNAHGFDIEAELFAFLPQCVDAAEECRIGADLRIMTRHLGRDLALQRLDHLVRMGTRLAPEESGDARKFIAGDFQRDDGVGEGGILRIVGDGLDLRLMTRQCRVEGRREILVHDRLEPGQALMSGPVHEGGVERSNGGHQDSFSKCSGRGRSANREAGA
jgi:hypothetical protein